VGARRVQVVRQRNSLAVDHHHPLRALAPLGFADGRPPFFAGAKLPSAKDSDQSSWPCASSSPRKARQRASHTPCSSQASKRRRQVLYEGQPRSRGRSSQRAPVRRTQRMPSRQPRGSAGGRPPFRERFVRGSKGAILAHCASVNKGLAIGATSVSARFMTKAFAERKLRSTRF
jgi:hypothetical protein